MHDEAQVHDVAEVTDDELFLHEQYEYEIITEVSDVQTLVVDGTGDDEEEALVELEGMLVCLVALCIDD